MIRMNENDAYNRFDDMLNESGSVIVAGQEFYPSDILKEMDPIAYRTYFNDYMDAIGVDTDDFLETDADYDESMDGDFDSAMTSAGFGTDEDYGSASDMY
jgi:hypothetical protein